MIPKVVVLLCAATYVHFVCSQNGVTNDMCFSTDTTLKNNSNSSNPIIDHEFNKLTSSELQKQFKRSLRRSRPFVGSIVWIFNGILENDINEQINYELSAHYTYLSMAYYFDRADHYMPGFSKFFKKMAEEEHEHAQMFMKYLNKRLGNIQLKGIVKPCNQGKWENGTMAMKHALNLEYNINQRLLNLHANALNKADDPQFLDFLETNFLTEQVDSIKEIANYVRILERLGSDALGEYQFDKLTLGGGKD